jgi:hypothetical protein
MALLNILLNSPLVPFKILGSVSCLKMWPLFLWSGCDMFPDEGPLAFHFIESLHLYRGFLRIFFIFDFPYNNVTACNKFFKTDAVEIKNCEIRISSYKQVDAEFMLP